MFGRSFTTTTQQNTQALQSNLSPTEGDKKILSVSELNRTVKYLLENNFKHLWLTGEISNLAIPYSGHWYLTLKDENAQIRCAMFRGNNRNVSFVPKNGMQVIVQAKASLYEARGDYQLIIDSMEQAGEGLLRQQFEALKSRLQAEGLFDPYYKKTLPHCKTVGLITSKSGAALQDMLRILERRAPSINVIIYPTQVQGKTAAAEISQMIALANLRDECDVLIVGRGGGSLEDLWCFNEEIVARAIAASQLPIISAVGHETDFTIADFTADLRAATPSAAAEIISEESEVQLAKLRSYQERIEVSFDYLIHAKQQQFSHLLQRLYHQHPQRYLEGYQNYLNKLYERAVQTARQQLQRSQNFHLSLQQRLVQQAPLNQSGRLNRLTSIEQRLSYATQQFITQNRKHINHLSQRLRAQHPGRNLTRQEKGLQQYQKQLQQQIQRILKQASSHHSLLQQTLLKQSPAKSIMNNDVQLEQLLYRLNMAIQRRLDSKEQKFAKVCGELDHLSPVKILSRGYSITLDSQKRAVTSISQIAVGEQLTTKLSEGELITQVIEKR